MTGEAVDAGEAERIGLISLVKPEAEFDAYVGVYARRLAAGAQTAIRYSKVTANIPLRQMAASVYAALIAHEGLCQHTSDYREGVYEFQIGRAHVCTPVTTAHLVCSLMLVKT